MPENILTKNNVERLLAGRKLIDQYRQEQTGEKQPEAVEKLRAGLKELGFSSIEEFFKFNETMVFADERRCLQVIGKCDYCVGRKPSCVEACVTRREKEGKHPTVDKEGSPSMDDDVLRAINSAFWDWKKNNFSQWQIGETKPIMPTCAIKSVMIDKPLFDWYWR